MKRFVYPVVLVVFTAYSLYITYQYGYFGFLDLRHEPWGPQVFTDLVIAASIALTYIIPDARSRGIKVWPYVVMTVFLGSVGLLSYMTHRALVAKKPQAA